MIFPALRRDQVKAIWNGYCFDITGSDGPIRDYVGERILEACDAAGAAH
jgi:hypothetical protein